MLVDLLTNPFLRWQGALGQQKWWWLALTTLLFLAGGVFRYAGSSREALV